MPSEYTYRVSAWWTSGRTGLAKCDSAPNAIHFSEAPELGGIEGRWTPEQLLLCSLAGCFTTTFQELARIAKFTYTDLEVEVEGIVRRTKGTLSLTEIVLRPQLTVRTDEEFETGLSLLRKAKASSLISRALTVPQTLEPRVASPKPAPVDWHEEAILKLPV